MTDSFLLRRCYMMLENKLDSHLCQAQINLKWHYFWVVRQGIVLKSTLKCHVCTLLKLQLKPLLTIPDPYYLFHRLSWPSPNLTWAWQRRRVLPVGCSSRCSHTWAPQPYCCRHPGSWGQRRSWSGRGIPWFGSFCTFCTRRPGLRAREWLKEGCSVEENHSWLHSWNWINRIISAH